jgi:Questin oxidase-like
VLHLLTSGHAMRELLAFVDEPMPALRAYVRAVVAGRYAADALPGAAPPLRPWAELIDATLGSDDEHLIKLVHSCREQERCYGGDDWQHAASRGVAEAGR